MPTCSSSIVAKPKRISRTRSLGGHPKSAQKIATLEYGQRVGRRYVAAVLISPMLLLSKARKHYVTIQYFDGEGRQQALVFRVKKGNIRSVLASLEARTGRRIEYQDDEARKAGR